MTTQENYRLVLKHIVYMKVVEQLSILSYDTKHQVCAMAVKKDFSDIHKFGYNGNYEGGPNERDSMEHGESGFLHAEENWISKKTLEKEDLRENYILFLTMTPCHMCLKRLINTGIREICILSDYVNCGPTYDIAKKANVEIYYLESKVKTLLKNKFFPIAKSIEKENPEISYLETLDSLLKGFFDVNQKPLQKIKSLNSEIEATLYGISNGKISDDFFEERLHSDFFKILYKIL
jgi:deoxycytidylate deaminase